MIWPLECSVVMQQALWSGELNFRMWGKHVATNLQVQNCFPLECKARRRVCCPMEAGWGNSQVQLTWTGLARHVA